MFDQRFRQGKPLRLWKEEMLTFHTHTLTLLSSYDISSHPEMIQLITGFIVSGPAQFINWLATEHWLTLRLVLRKDVKHCRHSRVSEREWDEWKAEWGEDHCFDFQCQWGVFIQGFVVYLMCLPLHMLNGFANLEAMDPISKKSTLFYIFKKCKKEIIFGLLCFIAATALIILCVFKTEGFLIASEFD